VVPGSSFGLVWVEIVEAVPEDAGRRGIDGQECTFDDGEGELVMHPQHQLTYADVIQALPALAAYEVDLGIAIQAHKLGHPEDMEEFFEVVQAATDRGIRVLPWLVLDFCDGYFPGTTNANVFIPAARELLDQWEAHGFAPTGLFFDMELRWERARDVRAAAEAGLLDSAAMLARMTLWKNPLQFAFARYLYARFVDELHARGWEAHLSTSGAIIDDFFDGDAGIRRAWGIPVEGIDWDEIHVQLYRSLFDQQSPGLTPFFVYDYLISWRTRFPGVPIAVDIGLTHPGPVFPDGGVTRDPGDLIADAEAALAAGIPRDRIGTYNLKGLLEGAPYCPPSTTCASYDDYVYPAVPSEHDPAAWFAEPTTPSPSPPPLDLATPLLHTLYHAIDVVL